MAGQLCPAKEGLSEGHLPPVPSAARKAHPARRVQRFLILWGHRVEADGGKAQLGHLLYGGPLASWIQHVWASRFPTGLGDCALFHGPQGGQRGRRIACHLCPPSQTIHHPESRLFQAQVSVSVMSHPAPSPKASKLPAEAAGSGSVTDWPLCRFPECRECVLFQLGVYSHAWLRPGCHCFQLSPPSVFCLGVWGSCGQLPRVGGGS